MQSLVEIDKRTATGERNNKSSLFVFTGRKAGIKITFVGLFWFLRPVWATLCTDYRQIWQGGGGRQHLTYCQS